MRLEMYNHASRDPILSPLGYPLGQSPCYECQRSFRSNLNRLINTIVLQAKLYRMMQLGTYVIAMATLH